MRAPPSTERLPGSRSTSGSAQDERQVPVEDEPGVVRAERTQPGWHGRGADMDRELLRHIRIGHTRRPLDAQDAGGGPGIGGKQ